MGCVRTGSLRQYQALNQQDEEKEEKNDITMWICELS